MNNQYELSYIIVDDDEDDRLLMRLALEKANRPLPVLEFTDGQEVIDYLNSNANARPDEDMHWLVVLDVNMPRLNGLSTVKQLRQNPYWAKLPVLMLSTSDDPAVINESIANGANGYITKPRQMEGYVAIFDQFFAPWLAVKSTEWAESGGVGRVMRRQGVQEP